MGYPLPSKSAIKEQIRTVSTCQLLNQYHHTEAGIAVATKFWWTSINVCYVPWHCRKNTKFSKARTCGMSWKRLHYHPPKLTSSLRRFPVCCKILSHRHSLNGDPLDMSLRTLDFDTFGHFFDPVYSFSPIQRITFSVWSFVWVSVLTRFSLIRHSDITDTWLRLAVGHLLVP